MHSHTKLVFTQNKDELPCSKLAGIGPPCALYNIVFTIDRDTYCTKNQKSLSNVVVQRSYQGVIPMVLIESRKLVSTCRVCACYFKEAYPILLTGRVNVCVDEGSNYSF